MTTRSHRPQPAARWLRPALVPLVVVLTVVAAACGSGDVTGTGEAAAPRVEADDGTTTSAAPPADVPRAPLTGLPVADPATLQRPALVVKVDNAPGARPQIGLVQADVVYEVRVEGITRFALVFHSGDADPVGPVRSARSSDIDLTANLGRPLFAWSGANDIVTGEVLTAQDTGVLWDVSHNAAPGEYRRDRSRPAPHNLYSSTPGLRSHAPAEAGPPPAIFSYRDDGEALPASAAEARGVSVTYGSTVIHSVSFVWDAERHGWRRYQLDTDHDLPVSAHVDAQGAHVAPANVVVLDTVYEDSAAGAYPRAVTIGTGSGTVLTDGRAVPVTWTRIHPQDPFTFTDAGGAPVELTAGQTWVLLPQAGNTALLDAAQADELLAHRR